MKEKLIIPIIQKKATPSLKAIAVHEELYEKITSEAIKRNMNISKFASHLLEYGLDNLVPVTDKKEY